MKELEKVTSTIDLIGCIFESLESFFLNVDDDFIHPPSEDFKYWF